MSRLKKAAIVLLIAGVLASVAYARLQAEYPPDEVQDALEAAVCRSQS